MRSRSAWSTKQIPGQPGLLHRETLFQKTNQTNKQKSKTIKDSLKHFHSVLSMILGNPYFQLTVKCNMRKFSSCLYSVATSVLSKRVSCPNVTQKDPSPRDITVQGEPEQLVTLALNILYPKDGRWGKHFKMKEMDKKWEMLSIHFRF